MGSLAAAALDPRDASGASRRQAPVQPDARHDHDDDPDQQHRRHAERLPVRPGATRSARPDPTAPGPRETTNAATAASTPLRTAWTSRPATCGAGRSSWQSGCRPSAMFTATASMKVPRRASAPDGAPPRPVRAEQGHGAGRLERPAPAPRRGEPGPRARRSPPWTGGCPLGSVDLAQAATPSTPARSSRASKRSIVYSSKPGASAHYLAGGRYFRSLIRQPAGVFSYRSS